MMEENEKSEELKASEVSNQEVKEEMESQELEKNEAKETIAKGDEISQGESKSIKDHSEPMKKDDMTFKRVEMTEENKKKLNEMGSKGKKSHGVAKAILIIIMLLIAGYCIFFVRNLMILSSIAKDMEPLKDAKNFTYTSVSKDKDNEEETIIKYYKKDNFERYDIQKNGLTAITWYDIDTNEKIFAVPDNKKARVEKSYYELDIHLPVETNLYNKGSIAYISLVSFIYSEEYNGVDCYVIDMGDIQKIWIDKETGLILRREFKENIVEYTDVEMNNLTEIYRPDLTGYEIDYGTDVEQ